MLSGKLIYNALPVAAGGAFFASVCKMRVLGFPLA